LYKQEFDYVSTVFSNFFACNTHALKKILSYKVFISKAIMNTR